MHLLYWTVNDPYNIHLLQEDNILAANASIISAPFTGTQMDFYLRWKYTVYYFIFSRLYEGINNINTVCSGRPEHAVYS